MEGDFDFKPETETSVHSLSAGADYVLSLQVPDDEEAADMGPRVTVGPELGEEPQTQNEPIAFDDFVSLWETGWAVPGMIDADYSPLAIDDQKRQGSTACAQIVYQGLERFAPGLLQIGGNAADYLVAGLFVVGQIRTVSVIQSHKTERARIAAAEARRKLSCDSGTVKHAAASAPANTDAAPPAKSPMAWLDAEAA